MPLITVVTAVYPPTADFFNQTVLSVLEQQLPTGWELEYVVQEDGRERLNTDFISIDERVRYERNESSLGVAVTRNLALSRARGDLVQMIDHDDLLLPGALGLLIPHFDDRSIHWAIGQADDLMPDGLRKSYTAALPFGRLDPGTVNDWASRHGGNWPIHCAALMTRTVTLRALGGWGAVPSDDDIYGAVALFELTSGYQENALTWLYRSHDKQTHKTEHWRNNSTVGRLIALQRASALRSFKLVMPDAPETVQLVQDVVPSIKG